MARVTSFYNRVKHSCSTTGTGTVTLGSATTGFLSASEAGVANGDLVSYLIEEGNDFEMGYGAYSTTGPTVTRATVTASKIGGAAGTTKMTLAGAATVSLVPLAADLPVVTQYETADRQNGALNSIYISKLLAGYRRGVNAFADGYKASDGIAAGSSSNYTADTSTGRVLPNSPSPTQISNTGTTNIGGMTAAGGLAAAFDGTTSQADASSANSSAVTAGYANANAVGKDWGSGVTKTVSQVVLYGPNDISVLGPGGGTTFKLQGSTDNFSTSTVDLTAAISFPTGTSQVVTVTSLQITTSTAYRYHRVVFNGNGSNLARIAEVQFYDGGLTPNNMTLVTTAQTADASVSVGRVLLEFDNTATPTLNTDLTVEITCNGGTNWASATLATVTSNSQGGRKVVETGEVTCTAGTSFAARIKTFNNKSIPIYGTALQVR